MRGAEGWREGTDGSGDVGIERVVPVLQVREPWERSRCREEEETAQLGLWVPRAGGGGDTPSGAQRPGLEIAMEQS